MTSMHDRRKLVIYHGGCIDGQGAAAAFYAAHPDATFYPGVYQRPLPPTEGLDVYFVDFSCPLVVLKKILETANSVTIIDHHKSAIEELSGFEHPKLNKVFDMMRSGAVLTWNYCFPDKELPPILFHIQDRDLWKFESPATKAVTAYLYSLDFDIQEWHQMLVDKSYWTYRQERIKAAGEALVRQDEKRIHELSRGIRWLKIGGHVVPAVNANKFFASDLGNALALPDSFAAIYHDTPDGRVFSLRSSDEGIDVSKIARRYGGGGHRNAAGFKVALWGTFRFELTWVATFVRLFWS